MSMHISIDVSPEQDGDATSVKESQPGVSARYARAWGYMATRPEGMRRADPNCDCPDAVRARARTQARTHLSSSRMLPNESEFWCSSVPIEPHN